MSRPTQMLSIKLKEKWHAIIATAGAARLRTARRNGPTVRRPGWLAGVACYQHERVIVALHLPGHDDAADVPDAEPRHRRRLRIEVGEAEHHAAQSDQGILAAAHELDERLARIPVERPDGRVRGGRGLLAVAQSVHDGDERAFTHSLDETEVAGLRLPRQRQRRERCFDLQIARRHFFIVMVVPRPTTESTSNSSISRFAPGNPAPTPCEVE